MQVSIKNVDETIFRDFKAEAVREKLHLGEAITLALQSWVNHKRTKSRMNILNIKPRSWGKGTAHLSEQIDEIVYG